MAYLLAPPGFQWEDNSGDPLNGGLIESYVAGTSTAKDTYPTAADADAGTNPNANPVVLDSAGRAQIWLATGQLYKIVVKTSASVTIATYDNVGSTSGADTLAENYIAGLELTLNAADPSNDIDIAAGEARDAANTEDMVLASALVKQTNAAWAVGTNAGGLDTGALAANTQYYVWLIKRTDTGVVDVLFSLSASSPTLPTNYDKKRVIGSFKTGATAVIDPATLFMAYQSMPDNPVALRLTSLPVLLDVTRIDSGDALAEWTSTAWFNGTFRRLMLVLQNVTVATDGTDIDCYVRVASTYLTTGYAQSYVTSNETGTGVAGVGDTVTGRVVLNSATGIGNGAGEQLSGTIIFDSVGDAVANSKTFRAATTWFNTSTALIQAAGGGYVTTSAALDGLKLQPTSGNFAGGVVELWGYR